MQHGIHVLLDDKVKVEAHHSGSHSCPHEKKIQENFDNVALRPRKSPFPMIEVGEAQKIILDYCKKLPLEVEKVHFRKALHKVLAEDVLAQDSLPPFPASIKDGYAVVANDKDGKRKVIGSSNAGNKPEEFKLEPGNCVRINTGFYCIFSSFSVHF